MGKKTSRIEEIEERLRGITPTPWEVGEGDYQELEIIAKKGDARLDMTSWEGFITIYGSCDEPEVGTEVMTKNAEFVANAPADIRYLLKRVSDLEKRLVEKTEKKNES